jgi:predicted DNA-binding transcriptional regulator AlpA
MLDKFLRINDVLRLIPVSRSTFHRMVDAGEFPKAIRIGNVPMWSEADVSKFMKDKSGERDQL